MRKIILLICCLLCVVPALPFSAAAAGSYSYPKPEVLQIDLLMQPSRYLKMIHTEEKQKFDAVVCMNEGKPQQIGVQVRGSLSLRNGIKMASKRIPMELCFDYSDPNGAFSGNPSLKLINCTTPARLITQAVAMQAFVFLDIPTPRMTPAFIRINDTDFGVYLAIEDLNDAFARNRFGGASLYRPAMEADDPTKTETFESIRLYRKADNGGKALMQYNTARENGTNYESYIDVDEFLRYMACETFLTTNDGFLFKNKNFFLADNHGKLTLLPWDTDTVFLFQMYDEELNSLQKLESRYNVRLFKELMQNDAYFAQYRQYIRKLNDEFLNPDTFLPWLENYIRALTPFFQRDATIPLHSDDIFSDLTTGNELYNMYVGNLPLTFQIYHDQIDTQLVDESATFFIPKGMYVRKKWFYDEKDSFFGSDHSIIFRVCSGYWRLRRQALWQNDGKAMLAIGGSFALVFACTVFSVYRPAFRRRRKE